MQNLIRRRRRSVWITANDMLCDDAMKELIRVGYPVTSDKNILSEDQIKEHVKRKIKVPQDTRIHKFDNSFRINYNHVDGVLLATYKNLDVRDTSLQKWLGGADYDGVVSLWVT